MVRNSAVDAYEARVKEWEELHHHKDGLCFHTMKELRSHPRVPRFVTERNGCYCLVTGIAQGDYEFETNRCKTGAELVEWIGHLVGKTRCSTYHIRQLIDLVEARYPKCRKRYC